MISKISENGIAFITKFEQCKLIAYKAVQTEQYYTIGFGHYGADVAPNQIITKGQALGLLQYDLQKFENKVNKYNVKYNWNRTQYDALMSFCFNIGSIDQLTAKGTRTNEEIANCIPLYCKSGGRVLEGLKRRRLAEQKLFLEGIY